VAFRGAAVVRPGIPARGFVGTGINRRFWGFRSPWGWGWYGWPYGVGYWPAYNYLTPTVVDNSSYYYTPPVVDTDLSTAPGYEGPLPISEAPPQDGMAHLMVRVPADAQLSFDGTPTQQTGPQREFVSPTLTPGQDYTYEIKARWTEDGKTVDRTRTVHVRANDWISVDMTQPDKAVPKAPANPAPPPPPAPKPKP
jgi:uncharacterized protein (TIGR03000 family)